MKPGYWAAAAALLLAAGLWQVSQHRDVVKTEEASIATLDQSGSDLSSDEALLSKYVHEHMGTSTTLFLAAGYNRALSASNVAAPSTSGEVYSAAQAACTGHADSITQANCVQSYLAAHSSAAANPQPAPPPPVKADYTKSYKAPIWTPDSSGWLFVAAMLTLAGAVFMRLLASVR